MQAKYKKGDQALHKNQELIEVTRVLPCECGTTHYEVCPVLAGTGNFFAKETDLQRAFRVGGEIIRFKREN
jgi:hypothetical protein